MVVIVGTGELGPCGSARTRFELEADHDLSPDGVAELAWLTGLVTYRRDGYRGRWVDTATGDDVAEEDLARRYRSDVVARVGLRLLEADGVVDPDGLSVLATVHLDRDLSFEVASADEARSFVDLDPAHTDARRDPETGRLAGDPRRRRPHPGAPPGASHEKGRRPVPHRPRPGPLRHPRRPRSPAPTAWPW